jgi:hypothetical protein
MPGPATPNRAYTQLDVDDPAFIEQVNTPLLQIDTDVEAVDNDLQAHKADVAVDGGPHGLPALADGQAWVKVGGVLVPTDVATQAELDAMPAEVCVPLLHSPNGVAWANMPLAGTELGGVAAFRAAGVDLRRATQSRIAVSMAVLGAAAAALKLQGSSDGGATWADLGQTGQASPIGAAALAYSAWDTIPAGLRVDGVALRALGGNGDGAADPSFYSVLAFFR